MITETFFGDYQGNNIHNYCLENSLGTKIQVINYGAILRSFQLPDKREICLGYDTLEAYVNHNQPYFGAVIGRVANRIGQATFSINNTLYTLAKNFRSHHLHGGLCGLDKVVWNAKINGPVLCLDYLSPEDENSYPGNLYIQVRYELTEQNEMVIDFIASTDATTPINLTHHAYWNLAGVGHGSVLDQRLKVFASDYVETDADLIPTGRILPCQNTPYDFNDFTAMGKSLDHLILHKGHDQCYDLKNTRGDLLLAAEVETADQKTRMQVYTTQPGLQFYTGNHLNGQVLQGGHVCKPYEGFCLETQNFPDAMNHPHFPNSFLSAGEIYQHKTIYRIDTEATILPSRG